MGRYLLPLLLTLTFGVQGCGGNRFAQFDAAVNPMIGTASQEAVLARFGLPTQREVIGEGLEVWIYRSAQGTYTSNQQYHFTPCDLATMTFRDGILRTVERDYYVNCPR